MKEKTLFQKILNKDLPGFISYETDKSAVIISLEGHPLVIPKEPYRDVYDLPDDVAADIMKTTVRVAKAVKEATQCEGVNLVQSNGAVAGQDVFHFHLHIKPRFENDDVTLTWNVEPKSDEVRSKLCEDIKLQLSQ